MARFKFTTKNGAQISACETDTEARAWEWICKTKDLTIKQAKSLYDIAKIK